MMGPFHFVHPAWLFLLLLNGVLLWMLRRQGDPLRSWRRLIDPALLGHFVEGAGKRGGSTGRYWLAGLLWGVAAFALAGPSWQREPDPFGGNDTVLLIVLKAGQSMDAEDLLPSRRERARLEIADMAAQRPGLPMGLIAYAGTAHLVLPPTRDTALVTTMAGYLQAEVMPEPDGDDLAAALDLAGRTLAQTQAGGSVLLVTDSPGTAPSGAREKYGLSISMLPMLEEGAGSTSLQALAKILHANLVSLRADQADTRTLVHYAAIPSYHPPASGVERSGDTWRNAGYWLTPLLALLVLSMFRRGTRLPWAIAGLMVFGLPLPEARAQKSGAEYWFITPDQKGQRLFDKGKFQQAAEDFEDPQRRGAALYRAGEFKEAERQFARATTPEAQYNRGTALIMLGKYEEAVKQFNLALKQRPAWPEALANRTLAQARADMNKKEGGDSGDTEKADEVVLDGKKPKDDKTGQDTEVQGGPSPDDKTLQELWLRRVQTKPADFLRAKFAYQQAEKEAAPAEP